MKPKQPIHPNTSSQEETIGITKMPCHLLPPAAEIHITAALVDGAIRYGPFDWRQNKVSISEGLAAIRRHLIAILDGEDFAPDSKVRHLAHIGARAAILLDAAECGSLVDDRPIPGAGPRLLQEFQEWLSWRQQCADDPDVGTPAALGVPPTGSSLPDTPPHDGESPSEEMVSVQVPRSVLDELGANLATLETLERDEDLERRTGAPAYRRGR